MSMLGSMLAGGVQAASRLNNEEAAKQKDFDLATARRDMDAIYEQKIYDRNRAGKANDAESARAITLSDATTKREQQLSDMRDNRDYLSGEKALDRTNKKESNAIANLRSIISGETSLLKSKSNDIKILQLSYDSEPTTFKAAELQTARDEQKDIFKSIKSKLARLDGGSASNFDPSKLGGNKGSPVDSPVDSPVEMPPYLKRPAEDKPVEATVKIDMPTPKKVAKPEEAKAISEAMLKNPNAYAVGQAASGTVKIIVKTTGESLYIPIDLYMKYMGNPSRDAFSSIGSVLSSVGSGMLNSGSK